MLNGNKTIYDTDNWSDMMNEFENIHKSISALPEYKDIYEEVVDIILITYLLRLLIVYYVILRINVWFNFIPFLKVKICYMLK